MTATLLEAALKETNITQHHEELRDRCLAFIALGCDPAKEEMYRYLIEQSGVTAMLVESPQNALVESIVASTPKAHAVTLDLTSRPSLVDEVVTALEAALKENQIEKFDGVLTYWDDAVALTARVADRLQLPTNPVASIDLAHDKSLARERLEALGFPSPHMRVVKEVAEIDKAFTQEFNFPVILKPVYGAASIGVMKAMNEAELLELFEEVQKVLQQCYAAQELMGLTFDQDDSIDARFHVVVEEFLMGREYDCDVIVNEGEVVWCELCDDWDYEKPHFVELGSNVPTTSPPGREAAIKEYGARIIKALDLHMGVHHIEIIDDEHLGPVLVECNPRMGGGPVRMNHMLANRVDLAFAALYGAVGAFPHFAPRNEATFRRLSCATACLYAQNSGILSHDSQDLLDQTVAKIADSVIVSISSVTAGSELVGWGTPNRHPTSLGLLSIALDAPVEEAKRQVNELRVAFLSAIKAHLTEAFESVPTAADKETVDTDDAIKENENGAIEEKRSKGDVIAHPRTRPLDLEYLTEPNVNIAK